MYQGKGFDSYLEKYKEVGFVETLNLPLVGISGLPNVFVGEVVIFEDNSVGLVLSLDVEIAHVLILKGTNFRVGYKATRTASTLKITAHDGLLGGAFDCMGNSLLKEEIQGKSLFPHEASNSALVEVFGDAPGFSQRAKVSETFVTGVPIVDLMIPLGKGQRELVLGDKKSGKTEFLLQTILSQAREGAVCIYAGIGKSKSDLLEILEFSKENELGDSFLMVGSSSSDLAGKVYLTPYTAMAYAEYFRDCGRDVLIVLDDMSSHAKYYRELSLIGGSFPGRESYPGDIFFIHSQLLERAGNFKIQGSSNSITCLPVAETVEGDISGYIQTNLMSMTDGHLFFDSSLFDEGNRPAVDTFLSVTRVGRQVQTELHQSITRELTGFLNLLRKHKRFVHFGAELSEGVKSSLETGEKITALFRQPPRVIIPLNLQYLLFAMIWGGLISSGQLKSLKFLVKKMNELYERDSDFRLYVDNLVKTSNVFNDFLANVMREQKTIKELIGVQM